MAGFLIILVPFAGVLITRPLPWRDSAGWVHALRPGRVHFCHDTGVVHS